MHDLRVAPTVQGIFYCLLPRAMKKADAHASALKDQVIVELDVAGELRVLRVVPRAG